MLGVMRDHFKLTDARMRAEIQGMHADLIKVLASKNIDYAALRRGLVPSTDRNEVGLIFDSSATESSWYGRDIMRQVIPLLEQRTTQSVLVGDLLGDDQRLIFDLLEEAMILSKSFVYRHSSILFCVYINNLSEGAVNRLHGSLSGYPAYLGYIPATFASRAKIYLSTCIVNAFLKSGTTIIMGHEDDRDDMDDVNMLSYPFEDFGYTVRSVSGTQFGVFLSFKIERPVFKADESDSQLALNAISTSILPLQDLNVVIDESKYRYLTSEKLGKLSKAGIASLDRDCLSALIEAKIAASYIYRMTYLNEHDVMKFNIIVEVERQDGGYPTRLTAALEYLPELKTLRLITLC